MIDWSFWDVDYLYDNASQVPGLKVSPLPSIDVCGDWLVRCCALDPWVDCVRHVADDEKGFSLYSGKSRLPSIRDFVLCSKSPNFAHKRNIDDPSTCGLRSGFLKVDILENSTYGALIPSFTSWWYAPL